jgi:sulfonate transport system permease protein
MAWMMVVGAELFGADSGMGFLMTWSRQLFQTDGVLVGVIVIGLVGLGMDLLLRRLERRLLTWRFTRGDGN